MSACLVGICLPIPIGVNIYLTCRRVCLPTPAGVNPIPQSVYTLTSQVLVYVNKVTGQETKSQISQQIITLLSMHITFQYILYLV